MTFQCGHCDGKAWWLLGLVKYNFMLSLTYNLDLRNFCGLAVRCEEII